MELKHLIENVLFVSGEPISIKRLSQVLERDENDVNAGIKELINDMQSMGLRVAEKDGKIQIITSPDAAKIVEKFVASNLKEDLSEAAMETLAAISYLGPTTKQEIEHLRGVNCAFTLRNLLIRGLIEKMEERSNRLMLYKISFDFLRKLGISKEQELPQYETYKEEIKSLINKNRELQNIN